MCVKLERDYSMYEVNTFEVSSSAINKLCKHRELPLSSVKEMLEGESFVNLTNEANSQSVLAHIEASEKLVHVNTKDIQFQGWKPRDKAQSCYFWSLKNKQLTICFGAAGTGKTSIALAAGVQRLFKEDKKLILCKPTTFVGMKSNAIAAVPGDEKDKLRPYVDSYMPGLTKILGRNVQHYLYEWEEKGLIDFRAVELMRGQHFEDCTLILDEAQNLSLHELASVLSRVGENSHVVVLGDPAQIDTRSRWHDTGLYLFADSMSIHDSDFIGMVKLESQYRGPMAGLCQEILAEYSQLNDEADDDFITTLPRFVGGNQTR